MNKMLCLILCMILLVSCGKKEDRVTIQFWAFGGTTILIVVQDARMALEYADRGYVFEIGKIAFEDQPKNLLENEEVKKAFLGG